MLRILFEGELLEFSEDELNYMYLDEGNESEVYRYGREALKIYKPYCRKDRLSEEDVLRLSKIYTQRLLLPNVAIKNADTLAFVGYSTPFIYKHPKDAVTRIRMSKFLDELDIIESDLRVLSANGVEVEDLHMDNVLYDGHLFIGDPGSYTFNEEDSRSRVYTHNLKILSRFVKHEVFDMIKVPRKRRISLNDRYDDSMYIGDQLRDDMLEKETVRQFVKRMTK